MQITSIGILIIFTSMFLSGCAPQKISPTQNKSDAEVKEPRKTSPDLKPVEIKELGDGVWIHTSYKIVMPWGNVLTNGLIIERGNHTVLIDTAWNDEQTAEILDWAEITLNKPVQASIHTHAHSDKMGGMKALHSRGVATYASKLTNKLALERGLGQAQNELDLSEIGDKIDWNGLSVLYPGGGHSEDNIVVNDFTTSILFGGCMIRPGMTKSLGNTGDANLKYWSKAVENAANAFPNSNIVVPSHGKPAGREILKNTATIARPQLNAE